DVVGAGINDGNLVAGLDGDQHLLADGVIVDVAAFAADVDLAPGDACRRVDLGDGRPAFVGDEDGVGVRVVGEPVRCLSRRRTTDLFERGRVVGHDLISAGRGGIHTRGCGNDENPV